MRKPDFVVGDEANPYLQRWHIIPQNPVFNIFLHKFMRDDDDRALHDHPWPSLSFLLKGSYVECTPGENGRIKRKLYKRGSMIYRRATHRHRIELEKDIDAFDPAHRLGLRQELPRIPAWTLFITGFKVREWGFWCNGWRFVGHVEYTKPGDKGKIGKGCSQ